MVCSRLLNEFVVKMFKKLCSFGVLFRVALKMKVCVEYWWNDTDG
jgi:hypothetical protein